VTELQYGLIGLGILAIAGVFGYNKWQENRHRKLAEAALKPDLDDVLLNRRSAGEAPGAEMPDNLRQEPVFETGFESSSDTSPEPLSPAFAEARQEGQRAKVLTEAAQLKSPASEPVDLDALPDLALPPDLLDPRIEFIVSMELVEPVSSQQILHSQREILRRLSKPVHWVAFNEQKREWQRLRGDTDLPVRSLRIGLQLVNRLGPVSDGDLVIFSGAMQALADELMAVADMPPTRVLDQAAEIDRFCAAVDLEIGLNLVARGLPFPGTKIRALAEAAGMVLGLEGLYTRYDDQGRPQYSLQNYESTAFSAENLRSLSTHGLTFLLDVPRVEQGERVFMQMLDQTRHFGEILQGLMVDDNRQPLTEPQLEHIRREFIGKPQATMRSFGLNAGSPQALRLFS
jgi:hypothetical protein